MNRRKSKLRTAAGIAVLVIFAALLGIVGAVENGAALSCLFWALPALAALSACAGLYEKILREHRK